MPSNPYMELDPATIDLLDDMVSEWLDLERHGQLDGGFGYGPKKTAALERMRAQVKEAWRARVNFSDVESYD